MKKQGRIQTNFVLAAGLYLALLAAFTLVAGLILLVLLNAPIVLFVQYGLNGLLAYWLTLGAELFVLTVTLFLLVDCLDRQHLHTGRLSKRNSLVVGWTKNSYLQFLWIGLTLAPLLVWGLSYIDPWLHQYNFYTFHFPLYLEWWAALILWGLFASVYFSGAHHANEDEKFRFAPGAISKDELGYAQAAAQEMATLAESDKAVVVAALNGGLGQGKSSYLRMMIESRNQKDFLYTYISLTETNETKSFSKLFAQRWAETLSSRYPSMNHAVKQSVINTIFKEPGNGLMRLLKDLMQNARWPLRRTRLKYDGSNYQKEKYANDTVAPLFSHIPSFYEDYWVIVIDEIERARFDEIYRTVETIERFRIEAQWGLPIKIVFMLCIDRERFTQRALDNPQNELAGLSYAFFERDPKTIDANIDLPAFLPEQKEEFIIQQLKEKIFKKHEVSTKFLLNPDTHEPGDLKIYWNFDSIDVSDMRDGKLDDKKAYDFMMQKLMQSSPRTIVKVIDETDRFMSAFKKSAGKRDPSQIRVADLVLFQYLKFNYPYVPDFIKLVHAEVFPEFHKTFASGKLAHLYNSLKHRNEEDKTFESFYKKRMPRNLNDSEMQEVRELVSFLCYPIVEYAESIGKEGYDFRYEYDKKSNYDRTLALPEHMWDALTLATSGRYDTSDYLETQRYEIQMHEGGVPKKLREDPKALARVARNMQRYYPGDPIASRHLALCIGKLLEDCSRLETFPGKLTHDTLLEDLQYAFTRHLSNFVMRDEASKEWIDEGYLAIKKILKSRKTLLEVKLHVINSLFIYARAKSSAASFDLNTTREKFEKLYRPEINSLLSEVVNKGIDQYTPPMRKTIYDYEQNYFYVMYQVWSGDPTNRQEIQKIRGVAAKNLYRYEEVIREYWRHREPDQDRMLDNAGFYMELSTLIDATRKAGLYDEFEAQIKRAQANEPLGGPKLKQVTDQEGYSTIKHQLIRHGYIKS